VVGRGAAEGRVEVVERAVGERRDLEVDAAVADLTAAITRQRSGRSRV
jgi:hypothetical protein